MSLLISSDLVQLDSHLDLVQVLLPSPSRLLDPILDFLDVLLGTLLRRHDLLRKLIRVLALLERRGESVFVAGVGTRTASPSIVWSCATFINRRGFQIVLLLLLLLLLVVASTVDRDSFRLLPTSYVVVLIMQLGQVIAEILLVFVHYSTCIVIAKVCLRIHSLTIVIELTWMGSEVKS